jgi:sigma-B regulation protein RsbU (phosphoserine phosphatase)
MKILVAEDDLVTLRLLQKLLTDWGYDVSIAHDGESARQILQYGGIHLCLLDWQMPELSGRDLCVWTRTANISPLPYVILLTAKGKPQQICDGFAAGANDYLTKPFDRDDLRSRLATLALRALRDELLGESTANMEPIDIYRLDLSKFRKELSLPS